MKLKRIVLIAMAVCGMLYAQTDFEVAAVKALPPGGRGGPMSGGPGSPDPGRFSAQGASLRNLIATAYMVGNDQVTGPDWMGTLMYSVTANVPAGTTGEQFNLMLQRLLAQRFQMTIHHETKTIDSFDLVVAKSGSKLKEAVPAPDTSGPRPGGGGSYGPDGVSLTYNGTRMSFFANDLARRLSQLNPARGAIVRVADKTGLTGIYDIKLHYVRLGDDALGVDIFGAVESQLGLKLQPTKTTVDLIVVDRAERVPLEN